MAHSNEPSSLSHTPGNAPGWANSAALSNILLRGIEQVQYRTARTKPTLFFLNLIPPNINRCLVYQPRQSLESSQVHLQSSATLTSATSTPEMGEFTSVSTEATPSVEDVLVGLRRFLTLSDDIPWWDQQHLTFTVQSVAEAMLSLAHLPNGLPRSSLV